MSGTLNAKAPLALAALLLLLAGLYALGSLAISIAAESWAAKAAIVAAAACTCTWRDSALNGRQHEKR